MTKRAVSLAVGLAALALSGPPAEAEPVPGHAAGIWGLAGCGGDGLTVLVNSSAALMVESEGGKTQVALATAEWAAGSLALTMEGGEEVLVLPPLGSLERCDALPGSLPMLFAEAVAVFRRFDELDSLCRGKDGVGARCIAAAFDLIDVSGDGRFSQAEISRALRAAAFFIGHRMVAAEKSMWFVPLEDLYVAQLVATALGPVVAANLIASHDYDGDGLVSLGELMQDRSPEEGFDGVVAGVAAGMAPEALSAIMKSVSGLFGLLR